MANNPYVNKVVFGSATLVDLTGTTATADKILQGYGAFGADGAWMNGTATQGGGSGDGYVWQDGNGYVHLSDEQGTQTIIDSLTVSSSGTTTAPTGHAYSPVTVPSGTAGTPTASKGTVSNHAITVTPSVTNSTGWISTPWDVPHKPSMRSIILVSTALTSLLLFCSHHYHQCSRQVFFCRLRSDPVRLLVG